MPSLRHTSDVLVPLSISRSARIICSSVNLLLRPISDLLVVKIGHVAWSSFRGARQSGTSYDPVVCAAGCVPNEGGCHTLRIEPKYVPGICNVPASLARLDIAVDSVLDTSVDANCTGGVFM